MGESILYALLAMAGFTALTLFVMMPLFSLMPGDDFTTSYHLYTYGGITLLCGVVAACTHTIVKRLDALKKNNEEK